MKLTKSFFKNKSTLEIAENLIGKVLVHETPFGIISGIINETEGYTQDDESCHAFNGIKTKRNEVMFKKAGHLYVYFTYGMHYCCNIVTGDVGRGEAVLIRSVIALDGIELMMENRKKDNSLDLTNGPAKVCKAFGFDKLHNGTDLLEKESLIYIADFDHVPSNIKKTTRVGISKSKELEWRFIGEFK